MHILYFHQHFSTPHGAAGTRSYEMAQAAIRKGHEVTMVCGSYGQGQTGLGGPFRGGRREGTVEGIYVIEFDLSYSNDDGYVRRSWLFLKFAFASIGLSMTSSYDVLFATTTPLTASIPGIFARWLRGKPFVFEVRDLWPELPRAMGVIRSRVVLALLSALEWVSYHSADRLIGLSPGIVEGIVKRGVSSRQVTLVPNGCDLELISKSVDAQRPDGVPDGNLLAVFTGTHGVANGLEAVLSAAAELKNRGRTDITIVLVGEGKEKRQLIDRAKADELTNVVFLDPLPKYQVGGLLRAADIGLQVLKNVPAFYYGTSPNKFFDYIAADLPVLNNYPGWLAELIEQHQCGFAVPPDNPIAFADALVVAANDRVALASMGARGRDLAEIDFDRRVLADKWVDCVVVTDQQGQ